MRHDINKYFDEIYLKIMIFQIIASVVKKTRICWPLKGESNLQKQPPKGGFQFVFGSYY